MTNSLKNEIGGSYILDLIDITEKKIKKCKDPDTKKIHKSSLKMLKKIYNGGK